jgi:uncharacterized protein
MTARRLRRVLLGALICGLLMALWATWFEPRRLVVRHTELVLPRWPKELSGLKVALLSDLHIGSPHWDIAALEKLVERTNAQQPDLVLLAGDYQINGVMGGAFVEAEPIARGLGRLKARLGVIAVLGNHDWWNDGERTRRTFQAQGITVLEENAVRLEHAPGASLYVVGLADQMERKSDPKAALATVPSGAATLVLVHEPDVFATFPKLGLTPHLTLAGHTHGGQVWLPLLGRRVVPSEFGERYAYGHIVEQGRNLFVTAGVGTSIIPVRFLVPPEIALLTLR